jgi:tRNA/tmRNA/rRNA uracil-C5-methylase (TrmA/RlmC/RlmD family)
VVFVRHALPGETVLARLDAAGDGDRFWRADAVQVLQASPERVVPPCRLAGPGGCGGCDWQHASLPEQRRLKALVVLEQLTRLGRVDLARVQGLADLVVEAVPGDDDGLGWRTRARFAVDAKGRAGLRRHRSHQVVPVPHCPITHPEVDAVGVGLKQWNGTDAIEVVAAGVGGPAAGRPAAGPPEVAAGPDPQRLVVLEPAAGARVSAPALSAEAGLALRTPEGLKRLRGRTWVEERVVLDGEPRTFRVTGAGFWQVHPGAASTLVAAVLAATDPRPGERAVDLYSGVGLFTAALALRVGVTGSVLGIESDPRGAADARRNLHDLPQVTLETGRVERTLPRLMQHGPWGITDVVVLDPPRAGAGRTVIEAVLSTRPRVVAYVACDPAALARDVATAAAVGYRLAGVRAFDLFPHTHHVECVATLVPEGPSGGTS